ncbi:hypothetical protein NPIL_521681, partial [Nephila pilipes]
MSLCDKPRSGRPHALDDKVLQMAIEEVNSLTSIITINYLQYV